MTKKQFESKINKLASDGELISMLNNIYDSNATFRDIMNSVLDDSDADKVFGKYKKRLEKTFTNLEAYSLQNSLEILSSYKYIAPDDSYRAAMDYWFAYYAADFSTTYGDFEDEFYDEIVQSSMRALAYSNKDSLFFNDFIENFEQLIKLTGCFGFGVQEDIRPVYEKIFMKWDDAGEIRDME